MQLENDLDKALDALKITLDKLSETMKDIREAIERN